MFNLRWENVGRPLEIDIEAEVGNRPRKICLNQANMMGLDLDIEYV